MRLFPVISVLASLLLCAPVLAERPAAPEAVVLKSDYSNDHGSVFAKVLAAIGLEYDWCNDGDSYGDLLDSNYFSTGYGSNVSLFLHKGGGGASDQYMQATQTANLRNYVADGGSFLGICMGAWTASDGWLYSSYTTDKSAGLHGMTADGGRGTIPQYYINGLWVNDPAGQYSISDLSHPINAGLAGTTVDGVKHLGSGYWDENQPNWNLATAGGVRTIATAAGYAGGAQQANGHPVLIENIPHPGHGRVVSSTTHPEHNPSSQPYFARMARYSAWGQLADPSGNTRPQATLSLSSNVMTSGQAITLSALNVFDPDGDNTTVAFETTRQAITTDWNYSYHLDFELEADTAGQASYSYNLLSSDISTPDRMVRRILMRVTDDGPSRRITERSAIVAVNAAGGEGNPVQFDMHASATTLLVGEPVDFSYSRTGGDSAGNYIVWDYGDGEYYNYGQSKTATYLAAGDYVAAVAVADNDSTPEWAVDTVTIHVQSARANIANGQGSTTYNGFAFGDGTVGRGGLGTREALDCVVEVSNATLTGSTQIQLEYSVEELASLGLDASELAIWQLADSGSWTPLPSSSVDLGSSLVTADLTSEGAFAIVAGALPISADANGDDVVDDADYTIWADNYGRSGVALCEGDYNGDGAVDDADYTVWADSYGQVRVTPGPAPMAILAVGAAALLRRRRPRPA